MSLEIKRIKLYKVFRKVATENNLLSAFDGMYPDFSTWERTNFKDDNSVISIWNKALKAFLEPTSKEDFFGTFACDILKTSIYCGGGSITTTGSTTGNTTNTTGNTTNATGNATTNVVNIKTDEVANGSKLVKQGMSGDIVREIQKLLIKHGFTNISKSGKIDGIYGSRTAQAVYDFQQKSEIATDRVVGKETWGKLIQEPTTTKVTPPKLDPKTGLPDNSFGLPKFDTSVDRFNKFGISKEKQDADLKKLGLKENMKLTDIITGMVQEQGELTPNQRLAMTKGFGPVSAEYADKLVKDGKLAGTPPAGKLPSGVPSMPSLKDALNPTKSNLGPVSGKPTAVAGKPAAAPAVKPAGKLPSGVPSMPSLKDILNPTKSNLGPVGNKQTGTAQTGTAQAGAAQTGTAKPSAPIVKPQPNSLTDVAKGGYLRPNMKGNVVRDMQVLIKNNFPEIELDTNGVFNQQTLDALIKVQKMLGVKPKNGKYGIFGPITMAAINKHKAGANDKTKIDPKTGLPIDAVGAMRDKLPKFDTDASRFSKYGVSKAQQDADLKKLGINEDLIKKIVNKQLRSL